MTNYERIKAMSIEEMDEFLANICAGEWLEWLESDSNENEETVIEKGKYTIAQCDRCIARDKVDNLAKEMVGETK